MEGGEQKVEKMEGNKQRNGNKRLEGVFLKFIRWCVKKSDYERKEKGRRRRRKRNRK